MSDLLFALRGSYHDFSGDRRSSCTKRTSFGGQKFPSNIHDYDVLPKDVQICHGESSLAGTPEAVLRRDIYRTAGHIVLYKRARKLFPFPLFSFNKNVICKART
uniref:Uncharacterized protein n=1 Tax=Haemonchus contortus TaxID=6289 RepID=A0A7I5EE42_HAECO